MPAVCDVLRGRVICQHSSMEALFAAEMAVRLKEERVLLARVVQAMAVMLRAKERNENDRANLSKGMGIFLLGLVVGCG